MARVSLACALLAAALGGCGAPGASLPPPPPRGGTAFPFADGRGYVEALRRDVPGRPGRTQLVVYFLDAEGRPIASPPTSASFLPKGRGASPLALKAAEDADPSTAGGLSGPPVDGPGEIVGLLSATIEGKPASAAIDVR